jgi:hypothetical protein
LIFFFVLTKFVYIFPFFPFFLAKLLVFVLLSPEADDPDDRLYDPLFETRTITGKACLSKQRTRNRLLTSMTRESIESDKDSDRTLVIFNYFETGRAKRNTEFFIEHGLFLREDIDWLFVANSHMCLDLPDHPSVGMLFRDNKCFDLGTYKEVILQYDLVKKYARIVTMNASVRGPFMPSWSTECWLDKFTEPLRQGTVKAVSTTVNCQELEMAFNRGFFKSRLIHRSRRPHMQSMILGMHRDAVLPLIDLYRCFEEKFDAIFEGETRNMIRLAQHNYTIFSMYSEFQRDQLDWKQCKHSAPESVHPYELIFIKVVSTVIPDLVEAVTLSVDARHTRSKQYCTRSNPQTPTYRMLTPDENTKNRT